VVKDRQIDGIVLSILCNALSKRADQRSS